MIVINNKSKLEIPELEDGNNVLLKSFYLEEGVNGIIPRFELLITGISKPVENSKITVKFIYNNTPVCNAVGFITSVSVSDSFYTINGFLIQEKSTMYGTYDHMYESIQEVVDSIWKGNLKSKIPNYSNLNLCQLRENNYKYLCNVLRSSSSDSVFYFDLNNSLRFVQLKNKTVDKDYSKREDQQLIIIKDRHISSNLSPVEEIEDSQTSVETNEIYNAGSRVAFGDDNHSKLEENLVLLDKFVMPKNQTTLEYTDPKILSIGDLVKLRFTDSKTATFLIISTKYKLEGTKLTITSLALDYDS